MRSSSALPFSSLFMSTAPTIRQSRPRRGRPRRDALHAGARTRRGTAHQQQRQHRRHMRRPAYSIPTRPRRTRRRGRQLAITAKAVAGVGGIQQLEQLERPVTICPIRRPCQIRWRPPRRLPSRRIRATCNAPATGRPAVATATVATATRRPGSTTPDRRHGYHDAERRERQPGELLDLAVGRLEQDADVPELNGPIYINGGNVDLQGAFTCAAARSS